VNPVGHLLLALASLDAEPTVQRVVAAPAVQNVAIGGDIATLTIVYDCLDPTVAGVAVSIHYDSSELIFAGREVLFNSALMGTQDQPDIVDADDTPATDRRFLAAWSSLLGEWPGETVGLPLELVKVHFQTAPGRGSSRINITGVGCGDCVVVTEPADIVVAEDGPTFTPTTTPLPTDTSTPTATFTPGPSPTATRTPQAGPIPTPFRPPPPLPPPPAKVPALSGLGAVALALALLGLAAALLRRHR
jgi:hypothetical protein